MLSWRPSWPAAGSSRAGAEETPRQYQEVVKKGLDWVAGQQQRDGHWDANGGQYPTTMTAMGGMVLLMEGSTIAKANTPTAFARPSTGLVDHSQRNGLIGNPNNPTEASRYMYGHGFGMLFLASVYGEEEDGDRRKKLEDVLTRAVEFCGKAQTNRGGWGYVSAADGNGFDEGSVTITQMQGLRLPATPASSCPSRSWTTAPSTWRNARRRAAAIIYSLAQRRGL